MQFIRADLSRAIADLSNKLIKELSGQKVLWLTSGGSNISATAEIMKNIPAELSSGLTIMLNDERWGEVGHKDSNWQQLLDTGIDFKKAAGVPVLSGRGFEESLNDWAAKIEELFSQNDTIILLLGMGPDGHVCGILPGSPAAVEQENPAVAYESDPYMRLTMTFKSLKQADAAYLFAFGEAKKPMLENLRDKKLSLGEEPAQILWEMPSAYVYSDQIGDEA